MANRIPQRQAHHTLKSKTREARHVEPKPSLYNDRRWKALSTRLRNEQHWICEQCGKEGDERTIVVDHRIPHRGDLEKFWDVENLWVLCKRCHDVKTAKGL